MSMTPLEEIRSNGDLLERKLYSDSAFASAFDLYPVTWVKYVLPARQPGTVCVEGEWKSFAELHYSAIIRCWGVWMARKDLLTKLQSGLEHGAGDTLWAHGLVHSMYAHIGSVRDCLEKCGEAFPGTMKNSVVGALEDMYQQRHKFIHKVLVPIFEEAGAGLIDVAVMESDANKMSWSQERHKPKYLEDVITDEGEQFVKACKSSWSGLLDELKRGGAPTKSIPSSKSPVSGLPPGGAISGVPSQQSWNLSR